MSDKNSQQSQRRNYYIDHNFQNSFILKFCIVVLIGSIISMAALYMLSMKSTTVAFEGARAIAQSTADSLLPHMIPTVIIVMAFASIATIILAVFVSHKIAGPLYRFRQTLKELEGGNFSEDVHLRQKDQLINLSDDMNQMITKLRADLTTMKQQANEIKNCLEGDSPNMEAAKSSLDKLDETLQRFRT